MFKQSKKVFLAFSLAEMMIVMVILSIILAAAMPVITHRTTNSSSNVSETQANNFTGWQAISSTGVAATDGFILASSNFNTDLAGYTSGIERFYVSRRDKYGTGYTSASMPIMKGETWQVSGARYIWFMKIGS